MDDTSSEEEVDDEYLEASQTERQILQLLKDKYGSLNRESFCQSVVSDCLQVDIDEYRRSLYALALIDKPDHCHKGVLIQRKDTQNSGGQTAAQKLAEDLYVLYQFLEGDITVDLTRLLSEKSKALIRKNNKGITNSKTDEVVGKIATQHDKPIWDFCRELLVEMRKDRDIINENIVEVSRQLGSLPSLERDIRELRSDMSVLRERVIRVESQVSHGSKLQSDTHGKLNHIHVAEEQMMQFRKGVDRSIGELRGMFASSTSRINNIELTLSQNNYINHKASVNSTSSSSDCARLPHAENVDSANRQGADMVRTGHSPNQSYDPDQTFPKTVVSSLPAPHAINVTSSVEPCGSRRVCNTSNETRQPSQQQTSGHYSRSDTNSTRRTRAATTLVVTPTAQRRTRAATTPVVTPTAQRRTRAATTPVVTPTAQRRTQAVTTPVVTPTAQRRTRAVTTPVVTPTAQRRIRAVTTPVATPTAQRGTQAVATPAVTPTAQRGIRAVATPAVTPTAQRRTGPATPLIPIVYQVK